jgi:hypothetical protein
MKSMKRNKYWSNSITYMYDDGLLVFNVEFAWVEVYVLRAFRIRTDMSSQLSAFNLMNKTILSKYMDLPQPKDKVMVTYVWVDGTNEHLRAKTRTMEAVPKEPKGETVDD